MPGCGIRETDAPRCDRCDAVCCRLTVVLMPEDRVPARFTARNAHGVEVMARDEEGWCVAIDAARMCCSIYEQRPRSAASSRWAAPPAAKCAPIMPTATRAASRYNCTDWRTDAIVEENPSAAASASVPPSKTSHLFPTRKANERSLVTHERVAADIEAFRKAGDLKIEVLGVTRSLLRVGAEPGDPAPSQPGEARRDPPSLIRVRRRPRANLSPPPVFTSAASFFSPAAVSSASANEVATSRRRRASPRR